MLMNSQLQGILTDTPERAGPTLPAPAHETRRSLLPLLRRTRLLMTLLPVPLYCGFEAMFGIEDVSTLWALLLTPVALLWYAVDYVLHSSLVRHVLKEVAHYGLILTPSVTLFAAGMQPAGEAWPLAKTLLGFGGLTFGSLLSLVLLRNRQVSRQ